jgi:lysophospholipase L1-like esterase
MISVLNAGLGGENASGALARLERDVIRHDPHLVTVCLGLNDSRSGKEGLEPFGRVCRSWSSVFSRRLRRTFS